MKFLALRYTVAGKPQLMVDTLQPEKVTERYAFIRAHTPEDNPRLVDEALAIAREVTGRDAGSLSVARRLRK